MPINAESEFGQMVTKKVKTLCEGVGLGMVQKIITTNMTSGLKFVQFFNKLVKDQNAAAAGEDKNPENDPTKIPQAKELAAIIYDIPNSAPDENDLRGAGSISKDLDSLILSGKKLDGAVKEKEEVAEFAKGVVDGWIKNQQKPAGDLSPRGADLVRGGGSGSCEVGHS